MWEITTFFYDTCVPATETTNRSLPVLWKRGKNCVPLEGERARLRVGGSHASLPMYTFTYCCEEENTIKTYHRPCP